MAQAAIIALHMAVDRSAEEISVSRIADAEKKKAELKSKTTVSVIILFSTDSVVISRYYDLVKNDSPYFDTLVLNTKQGAKNVYKIS